MSRKAFVSSSMSVDEGLILAGESCPLAPLMWPYLVTYLDDWGRAEASPIKIKAQVFPMFSAVGIPEVRAALHALAEAGVVLLYEVDGKPYMAADPAKWFRYQTHIRSSKRGSDESRCPCAPEHADWWKSAHSAAGAGDVSDSARDCAQVREGSRDFSPSPTPSPSPSPTYTHTLDRQTDRGCGGRRESRGQSVGGSKAKGRSVCPALDVEKILEECDRDPERRYWRQWLDYHQQRQGIHSPERWRQSTLANWLAGDGTPPPGEPPPGLTSNAERLAVSRRKSIADLFKDEETGDALAMAVLQ